MNCPHCFEPVDEKSAFCPHCGARQEGQGNLIAVEAADDPTYGAMSQANLMRLRGNWDGAREKTVQVLREFPNSGTAHSLMGDIYADQGLYEEAAQWYRMALDLEPRNAADARKLASAESRLQERASALEEEAMERRPGLSPLVLMAWAAGAFLVIVIALGLWINALRLPEESGPMAPPALQPGRTTRAPGLPGSSQPPSPGDGSGPETPGPDGGVTAPRMGGRNVPSTPPSPPIPAPSQLPTPSGTAGTTGTTGATPETPALPAAPPVQGEAVMIEALRAASPALSAAGLTLTDVQTDPRGPSVTVTLDGSRVNGNAADWIEHVHHAALVTAQTALGADVRLRRATVRLEMPLRAQGGIVRDVAFVGDLARPARNATGFDRRWWHPGLAPPPALASTEATAS